MASTESHRNLVTVIFSWSDNCINDSYQELFTLSLRYS